MRKFFTSTLMILTLIMNAAVAQESAVDEGRQMIREARLEIVRSELRLTAEESAAFWPLYTTYRRETDAIQDRYAAMVKAYMRRYENAELSDRYADELMETYFGIKDELLSTQKRYLPRFRGILPGLKVARLFQLENKINAEIDARLAQEVPLMETD